MLGKSQRPGYCLTAEKQVYWKEHMEPVFRKERYVVIKTVICDDEEATVNIIRYYIESKSFPLEIVGTAQNGREALSLIKRTAPNLVFMDIHMPYMDGFQVIENISGCKVIIVTAYDSFAYAQKALRAGVCDIIAKPVDFQQLEQAIYRAIGWDVTSDERVNAIIEYINSHYNEKIELPKLARLTFSTQSYITRLFKKHMSMTIISYVHMVRVEKSAELVKDKKLSLQEAAETVGYSNLKDYYKYFKLYKGQTPAAYFKEQNEKGFD